MPKCYLISCHIKLRQGRKPCFGQILLNIAETIQQLSVAQLEDLAEALLDFERQADLVNWLNL